MKTRYIFISGLLLLALAAFWKFALARQWTQRLPPGWTWHADYIGIGTPPEPSTGEFPADDSAAHYQRSLSIMSDSKRPSAVTVEDAYFIRDMASGKVTWEYIVSAEVNPITGEYLDPELEGQILVFPRHVEKKTYRLRSNYIKGIPLAYQGEEKIEGLITYRFAYEGRAEYTESYTGTDQYPGVPVQEGQEIRCAADQFQFEAWVEPHTGEILKVEEGCLTGDYLYDTESGQKIAPVLRWSGTTAGDDVLIRAGQIRAERIRLQLYDVYIPAAVALLGSFLLVWTGLKHFYALPAVKWPFASLMARAMLGQGLGLGMTAVISLAILYVGIRAQIYADIRATGLATVEMLQEIMLHELGSHVGELDEAVDQFVRDFPAISRLSIVDYRLQVMADSSNIQLESVSDQSALIEIMQHPRPEAVSMLYSRDTQRYMRLSQAIHGPYDSQRDTDVIGAVSVDLSLSEAEKRINRLFLQAVVILLGLAAVQMGLSYFFLRRSVLSPIHLLKRAAQKIERGQLDTRAPIDIPNELGDMGHAFNAMAEQIQRTSEALRENSEDLRNIIQSSPLAMIKLDTTGNVAMWNPAAERIFGWSEAETWGRPLKTIPADLQAEFSALFESLQQDQILTDITTQWRSKSGKPVDVSISAVSMHDLAGNITGFNMLLADISRLKQAEEAIKASNDSLSASVAKLEQRTRELTQLGEMADLLQACHKPEEAYLVLARSLEKIFPEMSGILYEIPPSRDLMKPVVSWGPSTDTQPFELDGCWALRRGRAHQADDGLGSLVCQHILDDLVEPVPYLCVPTMAQGEAFGMLHLRVAPGSKRLLVENQKLAETVAEQIALTLSNLKLREALRQQSIRDMLTGLFNRRYLEETLTREIERAKRGKIPLSVIMMDIDHFKQFNDTYGHKAGDVVLKTVGKFLQTHVRADDIACRYGGEEFTLIMPGASQESAQERAEQLRDGIHSLEVSFEDQVLGALTLSLGIATFPIDGGHGQAVLQAADAALYRAKQNGRDRVELAG